LAEYPALEIQFVRAPGPDAFLRERLYALLDDFDPTAIHEDEAGEIWRVFFPSAPQRDAAATHLESVVASSLLRTTALEVPDEDWARRSQQNLTAVTVDGLVIAPPWDIPGGRPGVAQRADVPVIVIEPSTGFGTGHHATTRLCLRLLQQLELRGARVVDIGTGSGVLALAAWKLGARDVVAVDNDSDALDNARANIARNGGGAAIDVVRDELGQLTLAAADVVVANLTAALLVRHSDALQQLVNRRGYLILSGFAPEHGSVDVRPSFKELPLVRELVEGEWQALLMQA
jgi:ribosomal protein L11 methyltransferase